MGVRIKRGMRDVAYVVMYFPTRPKLARERSAYKRVVDIMCKWYGALMMDLPARSLPILFTDLNDGMGLRQRQGRHGWETCDTAVVGTHNRENEEGGAGQTMRILLEKHFMRAGNTFGNSVQPTYFGHSGRSSRVDYLCFPSGWSEQVVRCSLLKHLGAKLQAIRGPAPRDHILVEKI